ncbi:MAG: protein-glutamate O-methyltransferase CheR [Candidatus Omnitrophica bacterium]|nr:protein-glutamate O-methyltransferase CheR [Candidatus Omnitrophota bacterium]
MAIADDPALMRLLTKVHDEKGLDFSQYKEKSLLRRINSRLFRHNVKSYDEYVVLLQAQPDEYDKLVAALTINVTEFFRNPESFEAIKGIVIPRVIFSKRSQKHRIIRAWSCGCSSGDEPYSLAMLFLEKLGKARDNFLLTIIGSDIDKEALVEAKELIYSANRLKGLDKRLLETYFDRIEGDKFMLRSYARATVRFRHHDIIEDKPFFHCDIILCRNLLIYFNKQLQEEVLLKFYEALNPGGFLVLGMTESLVGAAVNAFEHVNNRLRIYRRPEAPSMEYKKDEILGQEAIDKIVDEILKE